MALEISIMEKGRATEYVPLSVDGHWVIVGIGKKIESRLLHRLDDYYGDAYFSANEVPILLCDFEKVLAALNGAIGTNEVQEIISLLKKAMLKKCVVEALAD